MRENTWLKYSYNDKKNKGYKIAESMMAKQFSLPDRFTHKSLKMWEFLSVTKCAFIL